MSVNTIDSAKDGTFLYKKTLFDIIPRLIKKLIFNVKMERKKSILSDALILFNTLRTKLRKDCIYNYAASATFYIVLSIFPFLIVLLTIIQYTPITEEFLITQVNQVFPTVISPLIVQIIEEIYGTTSGAAIISIAAVLAIWSASKAILSIIRGINAVYNIDDKRNYFRLRFLSCVYVIAFVLMIIIVLIMLIFGKTLYYFLGGMKQHLLYEVLHFILRFRIILMLILMTLFFGLIFSVMPARRIKFVHGLPGSFACALGWLILSQLVSVYVNKSASFTYFYGSLTAFILMMLWLYLCMYIIFICAEVNFYFRRSIEQRFINRKRKKIQIYENYGDKKTMRQETLRMRKEDAKQIIRQTGKK